MGNIYVARSCTKKRSHSRSCSLNDNLVILFKLDSLSLLRQNYQNFLFTLNFATDNYLPMKGSFIDGSLEAKSKVAK